MSWMRVLILFACKTIVAHIDFDETIHIQSQAHLNKNTETKIWCKPFTQSRQLTRQKIDLDKQIAKYLRLVELIGGSRNKIWRFHFDYKNFGLYLGRKKIHKYENIGAIKHVDMIGHIQLLINNRGTFSIWLTLVPFHSFFKPFGNIESIESVLSSYLFDL